MTLTKKRPEIKEQKLQMTSSLILDTRSAKDYDNGHVTGSLQVGLSGQFASWAGSLIALDKPIVLVAEDEERVREACTRLARVGIEKVIGYLDGGVLEWHNAGLPLATIEQISVQELKHRFDDSSID